MHVFEVRENNKDPATRLSRKLIRRFIREGWLAEFQAQIKKGINIGELVVMSLEEVEQLQFK